MYRLGRESTARVLNKLQETVANTTAPLAALDIPVQASTGDDRRARKEELKRQFREKEAQKKENKLLEDSPIELHLLEELVSGAVEIFPDWVSSIGDTKEFSWVKNTTKGSVHLDFNVMT